MQRHRSALLSVPVLILAAHCGGAPSDGGSDPAAATAESAHALDASNGTSLNGVRLNGTSLNGVRLNGVRLNGVTLAGTSTGGVVLRGSQIEIDRPGVAPVSGQAVVGALLAGQLSDGAAFPLRIDGVVQGTGASADVFVYEVSYSSAGTWQPLCGTESSGAPIGAIPLAGTWNYDANVPGGGAHTADPSSFTLACDHTALSKCVEWGYKPWAQVTVCDASGCHAVSLADHHQACTRMVRADYCGNGQPWTQNGRAIDLYDGVGVQSDTESWTFEAEWQPGGARCMTATRVAQLQPLQGQLLLPLCITSKVDPACGDKTHFVSAGTLLMDEYQTQAINIGL